MPADFLCQQYGGGIMGWITTPQAEVYQNVRLYSDMYHLYTSGDRVCIYDRATAVGDKICHTYFLIGNENDTFLGVDPVKSYRFGGQIKSDTDIPSAWDKILYNKAEEYPPASTTKYSWTGSTVRQVTDFIKGKNLTRTPIDGYMAWGIQFPKGGIVHAPGKWYRDNGSWSYTTDNINDFNYDFSGGVGGLPLYYDENNRFDAGNVFNSDVYNMIVNSGLTQYEILKRIREGTLLDFSLLEYQVGQNSPFAIDRVVGESVDVASYTITEEKNKQTYARLPGVDFKKAIKAHDGAWIFYNIYVTQNLEYAHNWVDNGVDPPDAYYNQINDDGTKTLDPKFVTPKNETDNTPTEPDDTDNSKRDNQTITAPKINGVSSPSNNLYEMTTAQLEKFIEYFWNEIGTGVTDWFNDIQGLYNNLSEAVLSLRVFPCSPGWLYSVDNSATPVVIGRYVTDFPATKIKNNLKMTKIAEYSIFEKYKNFLDYTATRIELFLPFLGWVELPAQKVMNTKILIYFAVDMASTQGMYVVKSDGMVVLQSTFNFGIEIPITLSSSVEQVKSAIDTGVSLASSALSVAIASTVSPIAGGMLAVSSAQNLIPQGYDSLHLIGNATANSGQFGGKRCAICITRSIPKQPGLYGSRVGFCYNKKKQLADLTGFTIVENPRIDSTGYATEKEVEEIYALMRKGIIL